MSAAVERSGLAAVGVDLVAAEGGPGARRGAALLRRLADKPARDVALADLALVPGWLRLPRAAQARLARRVGLAAIAPRLVRSIDGAWLGDMARVAGDTVVDWAIETAEPGPELGAMTGDALEPFGFALLRETLPAVLWPLIEDRASPAAVPCERAFARRCLDRALAAELSA